MSAIRKIFSVTLHNVPWRYSYTRKNTKTKPMCLPWPMIWVLANDHNFNLKKEIDNIDDALCGFMWELGNRILNFGEMIA